MKSNIRKIKIFKVEEFNLLFAKLIKNTHLNNSIIDLSLVNIDFIFSKVLKLNDLFIRNNKSLVIVSLQKSNDKINIAPTLIEAEDIIEFEEIERDLKSL